MNLRRTSGVRARAAFTLAEVVMSTFVAGLVFSGLIMGYMQASYRAEWSGYSLAAQALAIQQLELAKSARWEPPPNGIDELTNIIRTTTAALDMPVSGTNYVWATNFTYINRVTYTNPVYYVYMVRVDTVWGMWRKTKWVTYTNTIGDCYGPDQ